MGDTPSDDAVKEVLEEPALRPSQLGFDAVLTYPDDGPLSAKLRKVDAWAGLGEQALLAAMLATAVLVGGTSALLAKFTGAGFEPWHDHLIRACTVGIAMIGAAFASHQSRHLSMDLVSRRISPRARLFLRVGLLLVTIFVGVLIVHAGMDNRAVDLDTEGNRMAELSLIDKLTTTSSIDALVMFGGVLIIFHSLLHLLIDADYLVRHKLPPERQRSGH